MCGIVAAIAGRNVVPLLIEGLKRLEYRGYDSAGIAILNRRLTRVRSTGRVAELEKAAADLALNGNSGIAHTRWATHGAPCERNAHPHVSSGVAVVHNGIIENHDVLRDRLTQLGYMFVSDTDTEVIAHLVHHHLTHGADLADAVRAAGKEMKGAYALAVVSESDPQRLVLARMGAPLLLGIGEGEHFAGSDAAALLQVTRRMVYLDDGDIASVNRTSYRIYDAQGRTVERKVQVSALTSEAMDLGSYKHYMQKEIFEQPGAIANTVGMVTNAHSLAPELFGVDADVKLRRTKHVLILACGTSYHAGMVARYWIESIAGLPVNVEIASEYRYRETVPMRDTLVVTISQSGETADTIAALDHAKALGHNTSLVICNVAESTLVRQSELRFLTQAGPEIGVASTKAFTTQLAALMLLTITLAKLHGRIPGAHEKEFISTLRHLPAALTQVLRVEPQIKQWARRFASYHHALFLGRGVHYPIAMEGALKLKEISYIHAEAYAAGELKHGPLALVDNAMPVIAIAPRDALLEKLKSNMQEVRARGGELFIFADQDIRVEPDSGVNLITLTDHAGALSPILHTVPLQLLAYHTALELGNDVDKPRNLAKSVTVE